MNQGLSQNTQNFMRLTSLNPGYLDGDEFLQLVFEILGQLL